MGGNQIVVMCTAGGDRVFVNGVLLPGAALVAASEVSVMVSIPLGKLTIETAGPSEPKARRIALEGVNESTSV